MYNLIRIDNGCYCWTIISRTHIWFCNAAASWHWQSEHYVCRIHGAAKYQMSSLKMQPTKFRHTIRFWSSNVVAAIKETAFELCSTAVPSQSIWLCYLSKCLRLDLLTQSTETTTHAWWEKRIACIADELYIGSHICNQLFMHEKYTTWQIEICASLWSLESFNVHLIKKYYSNLHMEEIVLRWGQILPFFLFHGHMKDRGKIFQNGCAVSQ